MISNEAKLLSHDSPDYILPENMGFECSVCGMDSKAAQINVFDVSLPFQLDLFLLYYQTPGAGKLSHLPLTPHEISKLIALTHIIMPSL